MPTQRALSEDATFQRGPSERVLVRRFPHRGTYDQAAVREVLDAAPMGHVAFVDDGQPYCIPFLLARVDATVYLHGSTGSRALRLLATGTPACLSVAVLDGLVLARSAFEHSANYRSAVLLGRFAPIGPEERAAALEAFTDRLLPGRWSEVRPPTGKEQAGTAVVALDIAEASVKVRTGPPSDDGSDDAALDVWAGLLPLAAHLGPPQPSPGLRPGIPLPGSVRALYASSPTCYPARW
jgi:nitroimidazol reductase NimA-like FMN-containing flavoprotein (pyridoxamine 5'-phosphate oxidase superfamily)